MTLGRKTMNEKPKDETQVKLDQAEAEHGVGQEFEETMRVASGFNMAAYAQDIYARIVHEIEMDRSFEGRQQARERETSFQTAREEKAIRQMTPAEAEVCHLMNVRPSEYVLYKRSD